MASAQVRESPEPWAACHRGYREGWGACRECAWGAPHLSLLLLSSRWAGPRHGSVHGDQSISQVMSSPRALAPAPHTTRSLQTLPSPAPDL